METKFQVAFRKPTPGPHSLGKLIEWKLASIWGHHLSGRSPHSLGKLIEWKLNGLFIKIIVYSRPHSLGKLIEWKLVILTG